MRRLVTPWACAAAVLAATLGVYLWTLAPTVTLVDSGELTTAAWGLGVAHPPGFPLYVLLAHLATLVPLGSVAVRVNAASAVFAAGAAAMVTLAAIEALRASDRNVEPAGRPKKGSRQGRRAADANPSESLRSIEVLAPAVAAGLLFGVSRTLWAYATIAEVYTLNACLIATILFALLRWRRLSLEGEPPPVADRWLNAAALAFGLGLCVHHVTVGLVLPACAVLVLTTAGRTFFFSRRLLVAAAWAFAGLAVYAYLPLAASRAPILNWGDPRTLDRLIAHVTGWQYRVFFEAQPERIGQQLAEFARLAGREFGPVWLPLALTLALGGLIHLARRAASRPIFWCLLTMVAANLAYNVNYEIAEDKDAYYLPVFLALTLAVAFGARALKLMRLEPAAVGALLVSVPVTSFVASLPYDNRRHDFIARDYVENIYSTIAPGGMLLTLDWQVYSPAFYLREVEHVRPDVVAIDVNQLRRSWYFDYLDRAYPETMARVRSESATFLDELRHWERDPELYQRDVALNRRIVTRFHDLIVGLVSRHTAVAPVYVTREIVTSRENRDADWAQDLASSYQVVPEGLVFRLYADQGFHETLVPPLVTRGLADGTRRFEADDVVRLKVLPVYVSMNYYRGQYLARHNRHRAAADAYRAALAIDPGFDEARRALAESLAALPRDR